MIPATAELIHSRQDIEQALDRLAETLNRDFAGQEPIVLTVMTGGMVFAGQLITRLAFDLELDYIHATRYRSDTQGRDIQWLAQPRLSLRDRPVVLLDDILDEGITLAAIVNYCIEVGVKKVLTAVLAEKIIDKDKPLKNADFSRLTVPDRYVFGYGMDYNEYHRNSAGIYALKE